MALYSSHRLIMGKEKIGIFSVSLGLFGFFLLQKCLLSSPLRFIRLLFKSVNLIGCRGGKKGQFFVKMFKNLLVRNYKGDEAETWHTCLGH